MQSSNRSPEVAVGLVYQAAAVNQHLKQALAELGANVVYDAPASNFDFGALDASGAEVVIVNLDPEVEEFDALGDLLADEKRRVVINDGEVSSKLSGWDQARWARHLAAKVLGAGDLNPPRPAGAEAIPVVSKPAAPEYPGAAPAETGFDIAADEIERALAADTSHALAATKAALVTEHEPAPIALQDRDESLREAGHEVGFDEAIELDATPVEREPMSASGFAMLDEPKQPAAGAASASDDFADFGDFGGLLLETSPESPAAESPDARPAAAAQPEVAADDFDLGGFSLDERTEASEPDAKPAASQPAAAADDFDFGGFALEAVTEEPAPDVKPAAKPAASAADDFDLGGFSLEPLTEPEPSSDERLASPQKVAASSAPTVEIPLAELQKAQRQAAPTVQIPLAEVQKAQQAAKAAPAPADDFDLGGFSLEPLTEEPAAAPAPAPAGKNEPKPVPKSPARAAPSSEWDSIGAFSLEPLDEAAEEAAKSAAAPAKDDAKPVPKTPAPAKPSSEWDSIGAFSLEPLAAEDDGQASEAPSAKAAASAPSAPKPAPTPAPKPPAPAPAAAKPAVPVENSAALAGLDLEFAEAGDSFKFSDFGGTAEPVAEVESDDELMKQFQALFDGEEYTPPLETGPVQRVWVLGASIGGPEAVREFLAALPSGLPVLFLLAQHMGSDFVDLMTQQLSKATKYKVRHVADGDAVAHGEVIVVPLAERLRVSPSGESQVSALEQVSSYTPSIDTVLKDVADAFGKNAGAIIFSGMAHDAIEGAQYLHKKGGIVWAQDPKTCVVSSMVDGAVAAGVVTQKAAPAELAAKFAAMFAGK